MEKEEKIHMYSQSIWVSGPIFLCAKFWCVLSLMCAKFLASDVHKLSTGNT